MQNQIIGSNRGWELENLKCMTATYIAKNEQLWTPCIGVAQNITSWNVLQLWKSTRNVSLKRKLRLFRTATPARVKQKLWLKLKEELNFQNRLLQLSTKCLKLRAIKQFMVQCSKRKIFCKHIFENHEKECVSKHPPQWNDVLLCLASLSSSFYKTAEKMIKSDLWNFELEKEEKRI